MILEGEKEETSCDKGFENPAVRLPSIGTRCRGKPKRGKGNRRQGA